MKLSSLLPVLLLSCATGVAAQETAGQIDCAKDSPSIVEDIYCSYREVEAADARVDAAHKKQISDQRKLVSEATEDPFKSAEEEILAAMILEQETWSRYRQARCERFRAETRGARMHQWFANQCLKEEALLRLERLDK